MQDIYLMLAAISITFFFVADVKCGLYQIKRKQQGKCYTWTESGPKYVSRPNRSDVGPERSKTRISTCTNTIVLKGYLNPEKYTI